MVIVRRIIAALIIIFIQQITERGGIPNYTLQEYYQKSKEKSEDSEARR